MTDSIMITTTVKVPMAAVTNAIVGALEGGYSPWLHKFQYVDSEPSKSLAAEARGGEHTVWYNDPHFWNSGGSATAAFDKPDDGEGEGTGRKTITLHDLTEGLKLMAANSQPHFADLVIEHDDATTHDVFMQYVILGEVIYG